MKKIIFLGLMFLVLMGCQNENVKLKLATGSTGGTYYPLGSAIAEILTDSSSEYAVNAYTGNASVSNIEQIGSRDVEMAIVQSNIAHWAISGKGMFQEKAVDNIKGIASLYPEMIQIIVKKDSGIRSVDDLRGKTISVGQIGSGIYFDAINILEAHGIMKEDIIIKNYDFTESANEMGLNKIDALIITSGIPTSSVIAMTSDFEISVLEIEKHILEKMVEDEPYYTIDVIPQNTYRGMEKDVYTLSTRAIWICDSNLENDLVYELTKSFWESAVQLKDVHEISKEIVISGALKGIGIPIHMGALKYYEEQGIEVQD